MTNNAHIFGTHARAYYDKGISVIPLQPFDSLHKAAGKAPIPVGWSAFAKEPVPDNTQDYWITNHPTANMGIVTGPQSRVIFIDVDSVDPRVEKAVKESIGVESPWIRVGQKGFVAAYRYSPYVKNFRIKDVNGNSLVECLAFGCQAVVPPSIHPKTKKPYTSNCDLLSVIDLLPQVPEELEARMRSAIQNSGIELTHTGMSNLSDFVARGARDNQMTYVAGLFAHYVTKGERTLQEAFGQMEKWFETSCQRVDGDDISLDKGLKQIVQFLQRDVVQRNKALPLGWDAALPAETKSELDKIFTSEHVEWSAKELKEYTYRQFITFADTEDPRRMEAVHYIIERLARSPSLNNLDQESIIAYIAQTSRIPGMSIPNIRKRIRELRQGDISGSSHMEIATAVLERMGEFGEIRQQNGMFYQWKGAQWAPLDDSDILKIIAEQFDGFDITKKQNDHVGILKVMRSVTKQNLGMKVRGVNFANGFLHYDEEKKDLILKPHLPDFGATYTLPYRYMPEYASRCPNFLRLLHDSWGKDEDYEEKVMALQEMIAASFFQYGPVLQKCTLLYGVANSGKSTILKIVRGLFPEDSISVIPPDQWDDKFAPTMMAGKLINICNELPDKKMIEGKSFKEIIDGDERHGQYKLQQLFKFSPNCSHWFGSNHLPKTLDTSEGFNRRIHILEFRRPIEVANKVLGLHNTIIAEEREAIAAWAIEAFLDLLEQREPTIPASHEELINHMANENNSVRFFLNESRRVQSRKRFVTYLAAAARKKQEESQKKESNVEEVVTTSNVISMTGASHSLANALPPSPPSTKTKKGAPKEFASLAEFDAYASANLISEDTLFSEYTMFCAKQAGVKGVGTRTFRTRLRELEHMHGFTSIVKETNDGFETCSYQGIIILGSTPLSG